MPSSADQCLSDMLTNIELARHYLGDLSCDDLSEDQLRIDGIQVRLQHASEAARHLNSQWPEIMKNIEKKYPGVPWQKMRNFSSVSRHHYDIIDADRLWEALQPDGGAVRTEEALRQEFGLAQIPPTPPMKPVAAADNPLYADIFKRSETFAQSMRYRIADFNITFEGRVAWLSPFPGSGESLALIQKGNDTTYQRIQVAKADGIKIGDAVTVSPSPQGFVLSRNEQQQSQSLRQRMT